MKYGKSPCSDEITSGVRKKGGHCIVQWLFRLFDVLLQQAVVAKDWQGAHRRANETKGIA